LKVGVVGVHAVYWIAAVMLALCQGGRPGDAGAVVQEEADASGDVSELLRALERAIPQTLLPERHVLELTLRAYGRARTERRIRHPRLTVIHYSLPSTANRLWVVDLEKQRVLFHEWVAHGRNSGENEADSFSNAVGAHMSSLGPGSSNAAPRHTVPRPRSATVSRQL
jgi:L,D-transpeptidase catalytic domain